MTWEDRSDARRKFFLRTDDGSESLEQRDEVVREIVDCLCERIVCDAHVMEVFVVQVSVDTGLVLVGVGARGDYVGGSLSACGAYLPGLRREWERADRSSGEAFEQDVSLVEKGVARLVVNEFRKRCVSDVEPDFLLSDVDDPESLTPIEL